MKINSVELENFKTHVKSKIDFSKGLNLILGRNGAGKTSILQALGFALAGIKWEGNYKDFITNFNDSDFATVKISFTARDGMEYSVVRKIDERHTTWDLLSSNGVVWKSQSDVTNVLKSLTGIDGKLEDVYKRIITAHQNDMTSVFSMQASKRKKFFDELFNTHIYKEISQKEVKVYLDEMEKAEIKLDTKCDSLKEDVESLKDVESALKIALKELKETEKKVDKIRQEKKQKEEELKKIEDVHKKLEFFERKKLEEEGKLEEIRKRMEELEYRLKKAADAKKICENYEKQHDEYENLYVEIEEEQKKLFGEEEVLEKLTEKEKKLSNVKKETEKLDVAILSLDDRERNLKKEIGELKEKMSAKREEKKEISNEISKLLLTVKEYSKHVEQKENVLKKMDSLVEEFSRMKSVKNEILQNMEPFSKEKMEGLKEEVKRLKEKEEELKALNAKKYSIVEKMKNLKDAEKSLEHGICPLLNEECLNLEGKEIPLYFSEKHENLENQLNALESEIKNVESEISKIREAEKGLIQEKKNEEIFKRSAERVKKIESEENKIAEELRNLLNVKSREKLSFKDMLKIKTEMKEELEKFKADLHALTGKEREMEKRNSMIEKDAEELAKSLDLKNEDLNGLLHLRNSYNEKMKKLREETEELSEDAQQLPTMKEIVKSHKERISEKRERLKKLKPFHDEYDKNFEIAKELEHTVSAIENVSEEKKNTEEQLKETLKRIEEFAGLYDEEEHKKMADNLKTLEEKMSNANVEVGQLRQKVKRLKDDVEKLNDKRRQLEEKKRELALLENKKRFMNEFRKMLNGMGSEVAQRYRDHIAVKATFKYQALTNRSDKIRWKGDYALHLITKMGNKISDRPFHQLSGGEQMIVALSVRAALNEVFSNARFIIFDEPTVNLDEERRKALSEYLPKLFEDMEQVIVITHDESFREMAEKVILVEKEDGISVVRD
jgi:exonuclease SbcC